MKCKNKNCNNGVEWSTDFFQHCGTHKHILKNYKWIDAAPLELHRLFKDVYGDALNEMLKSPEIYDFISKK